MLHNRRLRLSLARESMLFPALRRNVKAWIVLGATGALREQRRRGPGYEDCSSHDLVITFADEMGHRIAVFKIVFKNHS